MRKATGDRAVRDEGTSYHYLPAGAEARAHPELLAAMYAAAQVQQRLRAVFDVTADLLARSSAGALPRARHVGQTP